MTLEVNGKTYELVEIQCPEYIYHGELLDEVFAPQPTGSPQRTYYKAIKIGLKFYAPKLIKDGRND